VGGDGMARSMRWSCRR